MDVYNINYLKTWKKHDLETVTPPPFGLIVSKTDQPTMIKGTSKTLIDYIITDAAFFTPLVSDTPVHTIDKNPNYHLATSVNTNIQMIKSTNAFRKTIFDKKTYNKELFHYHIQNIAIGSTSMDKNVKKACSQCSHVLLKIP